MEEEESGVAITWQTLSVKSKAGRPILREVDGCALPGQMTALMGASGAGKTTLLNTLLARNLKGLTVTGEVLVNGQKIGRGVTEVSGYIQQEDLFVGTLTVGEHLHFQAQMRLPREWTKAEKTERVNKVARDMLLENSLASRIGVPGIVKGISGGELKRLTFATEILADPPVLLCDEPTTGLDSHMAMLVVQQLEALSGDHNKAVVCTIHQPASELFELFDRVLFLAGGRVAFYGSPSEAVTFFAHVGYSIPEHSNPADHYIQTLAVMPGNEEECKKKSNKICDQFKEDGLAKRMMSEITEFSKKRYLQALQGGRWSTIVHYLFLRYLKDNTRKKSVLQAKFVQKIFMGLFIGLLYLHLEVTQEGVNSMKGVLFYYCSELTYSTVYGIQTSMPGDFPLVAREYHNGIYPVSAYYIAKILSYLFIFSSDGMLMVLLSYFMIGLTPAASSFFATLLICLLVEMCAAAMGIAICAMSPSYPIAVSVTGPLLTVMSLTGGLMTNVKVIPGWINWIQYLSWFRFGYESLIVAHFSSPRFDNITCGTADGSGCFSNGTQVMEHLGFEYSNLPGNLGMMAIYVVIVYCLGYAAIVFRVIKAR